MCDTTAPLKKTHKLHINGTDYGTYDVMSSDSDIEWQQTSLPTGATDVKMDFQPVAFKSRDSESPAGGQELLFFI